MKPTEINIFLLQRGLSQKDIAEALGLYRTTVSALLSGRLVIHSQLNAIARYLGISRKKLESMIPKREAA